MPRGNDPPQRTCIGCMERDSKEHMVRIAVSEDKLTLDEKGRMPGRGAYLHCDERCITSFSRSKTSGLRSLKRKIEPDQRRKLAELIYARLDSSAAHG